LREAAPRELLAERPLVSDLVPRGALVLLVVPVDKEAPRGRLILPQAQVLRDLLDHGCVSVVAKDTELRDALAMLREPPALVVTDSQAFARVVELVPEHVPVTGFSVVFARHEGDLVEAVRGAFGIERLRCGDRVLMAEACTHHPIEQDIARVKIPAWLRAHTGAALEFDVTRGHDFPADLSPWKLVVHCGSCMGNRREMLARQQAARRQGVPMTNFGLTIAWSLGIFERALSPFPEALEAAREARAAERARS